MTVPRLSRRSAEPLPTDPTAPVPADVAARLTRRAALRAGLALSGTTMLAGCSWFDDILGDAKQPLGGKREDITSARRGLQADPAYTRTVALPPPVANPDWPQAGNTPSHVGGNLAASGGLSRAWSSGIGESAGYRRKITAQPVAAGGRVFAMDPDGVVTALDLARGGRIWRAETQGEKDRSTNLGGGVAVDGTTLYASTGRAELLAMDPANGTIRWRKGLESPARGAPTIADGRVFIPTMDGRLLAFSTKDGERIWSYQANAAVRGVLGGPSPAVADGIVVVGFDSGDLLALRADSGGVAWSDSLAAARGRNSLLDLSSIRGMPVIDQGRVFAIGLGGLMLSLDLRSGRRLWERDFGGGDMPWIVGDWVFVLGGEQQIAALGRDDGRVRWIADLPAYDNPDKKEDPFFWTGPVLVDGRLIVAGSNSRLLSVDAATGKIMGQERLPGAGSVPPSVAGGTLLVVTDDGSLTAFR